MNLQKKKYSKKICLTPIELTKILKKRIMAKKEKKGSWSREKKRKKERKKQTKRETLM